jgi:hypothetical protein
MGKEKYRKRGIEQNRCYAQWLYIKARECYMGNYSIPCQGAV